MFDTLSTYTRTEAIQDGVLRPVDATGYFKFPVALTRNADGSDLHLLLWVSQSMAKQNPQEQDIFFRFGRRAEQYRMNVGPGDDLEPVITIGPVTDF